MNRRNFFSVISKFGVGLVMVPTLAETFKYARPKILEINPAWINADYRVDFPFERLPNYRVKFEFDKHPLRFGDCWNFLFDSSNKYWAFANTI